VSSSAVSDGGSSLTFDFFLSAGETEAPDLGAWAAFVGGARNFVPHARQTTGCPASPSGNRIDFPHDVHRTL
jgi:hypothetical protein